MEAVGSSELFGTATQTFNPGPDAWLQPLAILTPRFARMSTQIDFRGT